MQERRFVMRISAGFALILAAATGVATAQPKHEETARRVTLDEGSAPVRLPRGWVELATNTPVTHGTEYLMVGAEAGRFDKLRIDAAQGKVVVLRAKVYFDDGTMKLFALDKHLDPKHSRSAVLDLAQPRSIDRVVITTESSTNGAYALYGSSSAGSVARR
jgi:hypothetical protein